MASEQQQQRLSPAERANLVAYLDGELTEPESRSLGNKLVQSTSARREVDALKKTWDLLDLLPRPRASTEFATRTLTLIQQRADREEQRFDLAKRTLSQVLRAAGGVALVLAGFGLGYLVTRWAWPDPTARLARDLSIAEHLDEYRDVGSFEYLQVLESSPEFQAGSP